LDVSDPARPVKAQIIKPRSGEFCNECMAKERRDKWGAK
jgi:hypothetical protein